VSNNTTPQRRVYAGYVGNPNPTERDRIMHLLDVYRSTEGFVAQYLPRWIAVSQHEGVKGGLAVIQQREALHAKVMKARLLALGGTPQARVPEERRQKEIPFFSSSERSDVEKLGVLANLFGNPEEFMKPVIDLAAEIQEDQQTKELLSGIIEDERASIHWIQGMHQRLHNAEGAV
jgi:bacterioferritin (cytochrome b1)